MTIISRVLSGAAIAALVAFTSLPESVDALATPNHNAVAHVARHGGISPAPHALRKRNAHQYRKRCAARQSTTTAPANTGNSSPPPATTQPPAPSTPQSNYAGNGKVGIAWNNPGDRLGNFVTGKVGYYYTWSPWCLSPEETNGAKCAPMLWGHKHRGEFVEKVVPGYADVVLGFNEPDEHTQANMNPWDAAALWNELIGPKRYQGFRLGSPAVTGPGDRGLSWMHDFRKNIGEQPDFYAIHWYDTSLDSFYNYVTRYHNEMGGAKIWITEFACQNFGGGAQCSEGDVWNFVSQSTNWLDGQWFVEAYFYFGVLRDMYNVNYANKLMGDDGRPNGLGWEYLT